MKLNTKNYELELSFKLRNVSNFETKYLKNTDKNLLELLTDGLTSANVSTIVNLIDSCQLPVNGKNLTVNEIFDFLDEYLSESEGDICDIYVEAIKELNKFGAISKKMGFRLIRDYEKAMEDLTKTPESETKTE